MARFTKGPENPFYIDECKTIFEWFSGKETPMNRKGDRNFGIVLTKAQADELLAAGYNVKTYRPKTEVNGQMVPDESVEPTLWLKVKINFNPPFGKPPRVVLVTCIDDVCKRTPLNETNVILLDKNDIESVDVKFGPYDREESNTRTAYVHNLYVKVNLDKYDAKYDHLPMDGELPEGLVLEGPPADDTNLNE